VAKNFISKHGYLEKEQARIEQQADLETQRRRLKAPARWRSDAAIPWRERVDAIGCLGGADKRVIKQRTAESLSRRAHNKTR